MLWCFIALVMIVGTAAPAFASETEFELTIVSPVGDLVPIANMPLADRAPLANKIQSASPTNPVEVNIILIHYNKMGDSNWTDVWAIGIELKDRWEAQRPGLTVNLTPVRTASRHSRTPDGNWDNMESTGTLSGHQVTSGREWQRLGLAAPLGTPWGAKSGRGHIDGMPMSEDPYDRYLNWASYDAAILGTAD